MVCGWRIARRVARVTLSGVRHALTPAPQASPALSLCVCALSSESLLVSLAGFAAACCVVGAACLCGKEYKGHSAKQHFNKHKKNCHAGAAPLPKVPA